MSAAIDYVEEALSRHPGGAGPLGIPEPIELDHALRAGETVGTIIGERFGISLRTVDRRRKRLRDLGFSCPIPERDVNDSDRAASSGRMRRWNERRRRG